MGAYDNPVPGAGQNEGAGARLALPSDAQQHLPSLVVARVSLQAATVWPRRLVAGVARQGHDRLVGGIDDLEAVWLIG
jgi:hypothetical protein